MRVGVILQLIIGVGLVVTAILYRNRYHPVGIIPRDGVFLTLWLGGAFLISAAAVQQQQIGTP